MKKILFIDDNDELRKITLEALELEGFQVSGANCGRQGIEIAREQKPDLILCDIMMPEIDGFEVFQQLRSITATSSIPVVFLTALAERENIRKGMDLGVDDYLIKPFTLYELLNTISARLTKSSEIKSQIEVMVNDFRDRVLHFLPHELLTPLNGIIGFSGIIKDDATTLSRSEIREMASQIECSGDRLHKLIKNFLNYIRILANEEPDLKKVQFENTCNKIALISKKVAENHGRVDDLVLNLESADLLIEYDDLVFIIRELVDNAFKFSVLNSNVYVTSSVSENSVDISITDHGIGFPVESMSEIAAFNQFNRKKMEQQGTGLGLITSMLTVQRYHGKLSISSDKQGTIVVLSFPIELSVSFSEYAQLEEIIS
jgi:two-component system, sensor histidine kinase and response regulator